MLSNSTQKSKRPKQVKLQRLLLNAMPKIEKPEGFFSIQAPQSSHFPLEQTFLQGIQLVEQFFPSDVNKRIEGSFHPQRISKCKGKLVVQGRSGILIDSTHVKMEEVSAVSLGSKHLAVAFENGALGIYTAGLQPIKEIKGFSEKRITVLKIVETPPQFQGIILISATNTEVNIHRLEKSFFSTLSCKYSVEILKSKDPLVQIVDLPRRLKHYLQDDESYKHVSLYNVYSGSQIWIMKLDHARLTHQNFCEVVYKKEYKNPSKISFASWGQRTVLVNPHLVLLYSFGNTIYMSILNNISRYTESQTHVKYEWMESFPLSMSTQGSVPRQIIFCQHIKRSEILLIYDDGEINIFHTNAIDMFEKEASASDFEIITYSFEGEIQPRFVALTSEGQIRTYADSFAYQFPSNQITYLQKSRIGIYVYCNWKQICELLRGAENYSSAMNFLIALYKKSNRFDLGVTATTKFDQQLSDYIHKITMDYLNLKVPKLATTSTQGQILQQLQKEYSQAIDIMFIPIELLVNTYEFIFLFHEVKDWMVRTFSERVFYKLLEPFIRHARIKYIPQTQLKLTLDYYVSMDQLDLVERLAIYFDLNEIEKGIVIQCCLDHNLAVSLAFICTQGNQGEFVTPFVKFWGMGQGYRKQGNYEYAQYFAIRALWYVRLCLEKNMALKDFSYEKYGYLISILTEHFFTKSMITGLLEIRAEACLDTLSHYFKLDNAGIVNTYCKLKLKEPVTPLPYIRQLPGNQRIELMLSALSSFVDQVRNKRASLEQQQDDDELFQLLLSRIIIYKTVKFTKKKYLQILKYLIDNYRCIAKISFGLEVAQQNQIETESPQILAAQYIIKIMTLIINEQIQIRNALTKDEMAQLYHWSRQVELTELQAQINFLNGHYGACIDVFLRGKEDAKERVFRFLQSAFQVLKHQQKKKQKKILQKEVKDKISQLIGLALEKKIINKPIAMIKQHLPEFQEDLIVMLESEPGLQLEYLQGMVSTETTMSQKGLVKYVERMCQLRPEELLETFKKNTLFPVEESLKICEQFKVYDCMQYLYERLGSIQKSVQIAMKRIDEILINRMNFDDVQLEPYVKIHDIFTEAVDICKKQKSDSAWGALFDAAVALFRKYKNDPEFANQLEVFYGMNAHIIYQMMCSCSVEHSVWLIQTKFKSLDMGGSMRTAFLQTLSNFSYAQSILFSANSLTRQTVAQYDTSYVHKVMHSFAVTTNCHSCGQRLDKADKALGFFCGHNYHKQCVPANSTYCIGCLSEQENQLVMLLNNANPQQPKVKIDKLFEQSAELRKANLDNFREEEEAYEARKEESNKENATQNRMAKIMDFDDSVKRQEDAAEEFEMKLEPKKKKKPKPVKA